MPSFIHPNIGVVLFGIVEILLGLFFIVAMIFILNFKRENLIPESAMKHLGYAGIVLVGSLISIDLYLELPVYHFWKVLGLTASGLVLLLILMKLFKEAKIPFSGIAATVIGLVCIVHGLSIIVI